LRDEGEKAGARLAAAIERNVLGPRTTHLCSEVAQRIEHGLGEGAVGGELAAIEGDEAAGAVPDAGKRRAPGEPARLLPVVVL
jgi:hypothetical protein